MNFRRLGILIVKERKQLLRDRSSVIMGILLPVFLLSMLLRHSLRSWIPLLQAPPCRSLLLISSIRLKKAKK